MNNEEIFENEALAKPLKKITQEKLNNLLDIRRRAELSFLKVDLSYTDLSGMDLSCLNLNGAFLKNANLRNANLQLAFSSRADFTNADLRGANFYCSNILYSVFDGVKIDETTKYLNTECPAAGSFIGYKKAHGLSDSNRYRSYIVKLEILEDALRSSAATKKCRCSKAKVLSITNLDGTPASIEKAYSRYDANFVYTVGEIVEVPDFNKDWRKECTTGIHFFMNREDAVSYIF